MNQQIKITKQPVKTPRNFAECKIHKSHSNNMFSHTRLVQNIISNKIILLDYIKTHAKTIKIDLLDFLKILKWAR